MGYFAEKTKVQKLITKCKEDIKHYSQTPTKIAAVDNVLAATTLEDGATTTITNNITNPDLPRCLQIKGNAGGIAGNVVITGTDIENKPLEETIVAHDADAVLGNKAFKTVTQIVLPARNAGGDTISVGLTDKLGLSNKLSLNTVMLAFLNNVKEGIAPAVTVSSTVMAQNTVELDNALVAGQKVDIYYMSEDEVL